MKAIIPAKAGSIRVADKNWREFHDGKSLVDLNIEALLSAGLKPSEIYVSSDSLDRLVEVCERYGVHGMERNRRLCLNESSLQDFVRGIAADVPGDDDIVWSQVCDPLFNEHAKVLSDWDHCKSFSDSICVVYPRKQYLLNASFEPIGWGFGEWHVPSQNLPTMYQFPFTMSVLTRDCIRDCGYHIGKNPAWYVARSAGIDIDTESDFRVAQLLYSERAKLKS